MRMGCRIEAGERARVRGNGLRFAKKYAEAIFIVSDESYHFLKDL
jgi:hypothetical protein